MKTARFPSLLSLALGAFVAGSLLGSSASAQAIQGEFLVAGSPDPTSDVGGGLFLVDAANGSTTALTGVTGDLRRATTLVPHPTVPTRWFVGINGEVKGSPGAAALYQVDMAGGQVIRAVQLNTDSMLADVEIMTLQLVDDQLYFGTRTRVGSLSINGGTTKTLFTFSANFNYPEFVSDAATSTATSMRAAASGTPAEARSTVSTCRTRLPPSSSSRSISSRPTFAASSSTARAA
jgi:hypothetical protein